MANLLLTDYPKINTQQKLIYQQCLTINCLRFMFTNVKYCDKKKNQVQCGTCTCMIIHTFADFIIIFQIQIRLNAATLKRATSKRKQTLLVKSAMKGQVSLGY